MRQPSLANSATIWSLRRRLPQSQPPSTRKSIICSGLAFYLQFNPLDTFFMEVPPSPNKQKREKRERQHSSRAGEVNVVVLALAHKDVSNSSRMDNDLQRHIHHSRSTVCLLTGMLDVPSKRSNCLEQPSKRLPKYHKKVFIKK